MTDTATTGISERADYVLDGGAGGPTASPGDYLYYSTRTFALESGAWGLFRVHDKRQSDLRPLPGSPAPRPGTASPAEGGRGGHPATNRGPTPCPRAARTAVSTPRWSPRRPRPVRSAPRGGTTRCRCSTSPCRPRRSRTPAASSMPLTSDVAAVKSGTKPVEPLVLRANKGDCLTITLKNETSPDSLYGGRRGRTRPVQAGPQPAALVRFRRGSQPGHHGASGRDDHVHLPRGQGTRLLAVPEPGQPGLPCGTAPTAC
ncbi:hypothetical protein LV779_19155 [Streptomyces thinghirensis]|nr:hypothetical protein [Streptomyces thinghirensis]